MRPTPHRIARIVLRGAGAALAATLVAGAGTVAVAAASGATAVPHAAAAGLPARVTVVPVAGDWYAPRGTSITFRGVTRAMLAGLEVVGSRSGLHTGTIRAYAGGIAVFTPSRPFAGGERVTVRAPGLNVTGVRGAPYAFGVARPASPTQAAAALRLAATDDRATAPATGRSSAATQAGTAPRQYTPPPCATPSFRSNPGLNAQGLCMNVGVTTHGTEPGSYLFLTPAESGAGIFSDDGNLVWWNPGHGHSTLDESVVQYHGTPYVAVWSGQSSFFGDGVVTLYDEHYRVAGVVTAGGAFAGDSIDLHEFQITPAGNALIGVYEPVDVPIGSTVQPVLQYVVQEVSLVQDSTGIHTGAVLFEWSSLTDVPTSASETPNAGPGTAWDYFHGNAVSQDTDGNLLVSARNTWGIYKLDTHSTDAKFGHVLWEVGAKGDSQLSPTPWCYQHDISPLGGGKYSLFDDGGVGPGCIPGVNEHPARGLIVTITPGSPATVTLDNAYTHNPAILAGFTGSTQVLPTGNVLVDWANIPQITEYSPSGSVLMDLSISSGSYRGTRWAWVGEPLTPPSIAATSTAGTTTVWASWNGSTQVTGWQILGGNSPSTLRPISIPHAKRGFETVMTVPGTFGVVAVQALTPSRTVLAQSPVAYTSGYVVERTTGAVQGVGDARFVGNAAPPGVQAAGIAELPQTGGYWVAGTNGAVYAYGKAPFHGSAAGKHLNAPVVGIAANRDGAGYWLTSSDGGVFNYGTAGFFGSAGGHHINSPVVGIAPTQDGKGYWLAAADGGVFTYGDARFHGSAGGAALPSRIVGISATKDGGGYWLFAANGTVYNFGDAPAYGSAPASRLSGPVVAGAATVDYHGYWLITTTGQVLGFGDAPSYGAPASSTAAAGIAAA